MPIYFPWLKITLWRSMTQRCLVECAQWSRTGSLSLSFFTLYRAPRNPKAFSAFSFYTINQKVLKMNDIFVLFNGFSEMSGDSEMLANCSCTLIRGKHNIIVDTMTAWDAEKIVKALKDHSISPDMIHYVISTHGHSDHIGNNNLFLQAKHIVGFSISFKEKYFLHGFDIGEKYTINESVEVIPTPGHTLSDVTVIVKTNEGVVGIAGDLFEKFEDIQNPTIWMSAGSENIHLQRKNRIVVAEKADWIVPGHGKKFKVTEEIRNTLRNQAGDTVNY